MNGFNFFIGYLEIFLIVFSRIMGLFVSAPFYSGVAMTMRFKIAFAFFVSIIATPLVVGMGISAGDGLPDLGVRLISNFVFGVGIGFILFIIINAFQLSAQVFSIQMGLGMNEVFDPISDTQVPALGNILGIMVILLLIRIDGHYYMIQILVESFSKVDLINLHASGLFVKGFLSAISGMFETGMKIAMPVIGVSIILDLAMGLIARVAPQFNVMIMGFNIKLVAGFVALWLILPSVVDLGQDVVREMLQNADNLIRYMKKV
jgi:flagellar biosynthetic protein FliR